MTGRVRRTASKRQTVGAAFKVRDESVPVGEAFQQTGVERVPLVVIMSRTSLQLVRRLIEARGWPRRSKPGAALERAQKDGALSLMPLLERYGGTELAQANFIVLPALDGMAGVDAYRTWEARVHGGTVVLYPPGADTSVAPERSRFAIAPGVQFFPFGGRQEDALAAPEFELLFGGSKGGSKSSYIVNAALRQVDRPAYKALIFRKTERALEELEARAKEVYTALGAHHLVADKTWTFPSGAKIEFGFADVESDTDRYQGREFAFVGGDEFAQVADPKVRDRLISECRCPDPDVIRMVRWTANPIGPGVAHLKRIFIGPCGEDGSRVHHDQYEIEGLGTVKLARRFVPSRVTDNPVYRDDPVYMATLHSLPNRMKRLLLHGDWSAALGTALDELSRVKHWRSAFAVPQHWTLYGFFDWGFSHRWAFVAVAVADDGVAWVVDTLWGHRQQPDEIAARIRAWVGEDGRVPRPIWGSKLCFASTGWQGNNLPTFAEQFARARLPMMQANEDPGSRITGLNNLRQWLAWQHTGPNGGEGEARLRFMDTHGNEILFQQLEAMVPDPDNPEDVLKVDYDPDAEHDGVNASGDDGYDALKMFACLRPLVPKAPKKKQEPNPNRDDGLERIMAARARAAHSAGRGF